MRDLLFDARSIEFFDILEFLMLPNRSNTNSTSDFYQICQSHIRSLFWVFVQYPWTKILESISSLFEKGIGLRLSEIWCLNYKDSRVCLFHKIRYFYWRAQQFQFLWSVSSRIHVLREHSVKQDLESDSEFCISVRPGWHLFGFLSLSESLSESVSEIVSEVLTSSETVSESMSEVPVSKRTILNKKGPKQITYQTYYNIFYHLISMI